MPEVFRGLWIALGVTLVLTALFDAVGTLVTTRNRKGRYWPTNLLYRHSWKFWRMFGLRRRDEDRRERILTAYGPISLLMLLTIWVGLEVFGWGFVWYGLRDSFTGISSPLDGIYFSGVDFFTVGFGDILAVKGGTRLLVVVAAFSGVTTMALVIGFLPTLYGAYQDRERQLLLLDDVSGTYVTPIGLVDAYTTNGDLEPFYAMLRDWERWVASVMETHTAYRMLTLFRSRRTGQSWLTAIRVVTDSAVIVLASVEGAGLRAPVLLYRRSVELVDQLTRQVKVDAPPERDLEAEEAEFRRDYDRLGSFGLSLRPYDDAWSTLRQLRESYVPALASLSEALLSPTRFKNPEVRYPSIVEHLAGERRRSQPPPS
jgi:hypothetical protein